MKHTKTPWITEHDEESGDIKIWAGSAIEERHTGCYQAAGEMNLYSVVFNDGCPGDEESIANAHHIVKCVNAHDALVDSLQEIVEHLESIADAEGMSMVDHPVYQRAKQALEAAGERV